MKFIVFLDVFCCISLLFGSDARPTPAPFDVFLHRGANIRDLYDVNEIMNYMQQKMLDYVLHEILTDYLKELMIMRKYFDLRISVNAVDSIIDVIEFSNLTLDELLLFRKQILDVTKNNEIIREYKHLREHFIHDIRYVFAYLETEFETFNEQMMNMNDRFSFECRLREATFSYGSAMELIGIYYYWAQGLLFYPDKEINIPALRRSIYTRVALERPYFNQYFAMHPIPDIGGAEF